MKQITKFITEAGYSRQPETVLHFENGACAALYLFELEGQISDGKYENARPANHWYWIGNTKIVIDGETYYAGPKHKKKYDLSEWPGYIKKGGEWKWAERVLGYGAFGMAFPDEVVKAAEQKYDYSPIIDTWAKAITDETGWAGVEEASNKDDYYAKKYLKNPFNTEKNFNAFEEQFKNYDSRALRADLASMAETVNTLQ